MSDQFEVAVIGGGCFWCVEAVFREVEGIHSAVSGYSGGKVPGHPTYREICSGLTGHAEVVRLEFDPKVISYKKILEIFLTTHDPTTLNRQGADVGTQYRSVIFYQDERQKQIAEQVLVEVQKYYEDFIVTELAEAKPFYEATEDHQNYYNKQPNQGYCSYVITPKLQKLRKLHSEQLRIS
ncbi:peptide-methionine (S)-S-oxide reductase MsrA [Gilvibacter sediminis]|uniref:peptide-methionine (S)-S-oxide reductase MsrA n=1 Tax=Gilvibacter sediminis TaxID=379071 RepID=UPI0023501488|nr:peptide-methionine (S)-S-oxide reductase MsrA [Gilvibacter sediminis]MDC7996602.1 peptide-methionine (S)-S-oxide reductase MsrA [Gilvibacter sediminis]